MKRADVQSWYVQSMVQILWVLSPALLLASIAPFYHNSIPSSTIPLFASKSEVISGNDATEGRIAQMCLYKTVKSQGGITLFLGTSLAWRMDWRVKTQRVKTSENFSEESNLPREISRYPEIL